MRFVLMTHILLKKCNAIGIFELLSIQKYTITLRILAYGVFRDAVDEYYRLSNSTVMETMKWYVVATRACYEDTYLKQLTSEDVVQQKSINEDKGLLGMFEFINYMH
jgi:hypothetical protein